MPCPICQYRTEKLKKPTMCPKCPEYQDTYINPSENGGGLSKEE
jgi:hypothetical protein